MLAAALCLSGCSKYKSDYNAVGFVHSNEAHSSLMNFYLFDGMIVFKMNCSKDGEKINYEAKLETGDIEVFYDCGDGKKDLFTIRGGDRVSTDGGELKKGTVYIIVQTNAECLNGEIRFEIE